MVYKRKDSPYYWMSFTDQYGHRVLESTGVTSKTVAKKIESSRRTEVAQGKYLGKVKQINPTFEQLCDLYWKHRASKLKAKGIESMLKTWKAEFGKRPVRSIKPSHCEQYFAGFDKKPATVN